MWSFRLGSVFAFVISKKFPSFLFRYFHSEILCIVLHFWFLTCMMVFLCFQKMPFLSLPCRKSSAIEDAHMYKSIPKDDLWLVDCAAALLTPQLLYFVHKNCIITSTRIRCTQSDKFWGFSSIQVGDIAAGSPVPACLTCLWFPNPAALCLCYNGWM